ncbi:MAG: PQQ-dependent sugar dehydrogenase [Acidobacteriota bacterium]
MKKLSVWSAWCAAWVVAWWIPVASNAIELPDGFESVQVIGALESPAGLVFSPDGRLFIAERITGRLRVAERDGDGWTLRAQPFYTFDVPRDADGNPAAHRSGGLRDLAFDPDYATNGYLYAFYMRHDPRHNRVVRLEVDPLDPNRALAGSETLLFEMPFNDTESSGSHNGGAVEFGDDGALYVTTGDGWNGGDDVQSLETYTGKVFRLNPDGSIPTDNPFYGQATGPLRAIYALGLRNPFSMSREPTTGALFVNDARGSDKADIYRVEASANYGHDGFDGVGVETEPFADGGVPGGRVITGGAWYPTADAADAFPEAYRGSYFIALWGSNGGDAGDIHRVVSLDDPTVLSFATDVRIGDGKPVLTRVDPLSSDLYYMLTTYQTGDGSVHRIRYTGAPECDAGPSTPPVAHWRFDDGAGAQATDSVGAGAPDGLLVGAGWSGDATDGSVGSIEFDGVDDRVELGTYDLSPGADGAVSLLFWFRADDFDTMDGRFLSKATGVQEQDHLWMVSTLDVSGSARLRFRLRTGAQTSTLVASGGDLAPGVWYHVAATYDGQAMRLFLNGVEVGSLAKTGAVAADPGVDAWIGDQPGGARPFDGLIDDVRIYDRALGSSELLGLLTGQGPCGLFGDGFETGDAGRWSAVFP